MATSRSARSQSQASTQMLYAARPQSYVRLDPFDNAVRPSSRAKHARSSSAPALGDAYRSTASTSALFQDATLRGRDLSTFSTPSIASSMRQRRASSAAPAASAERRSQSSRRQSAPPSPAVIRCGAGSSEDTSVPKSTITAFLSSRTAEATYASRHLRDVLLTLRALLVTREDGTYLPPAFWLKEKIKLRVYGPAHTEIYERRSDSSFFAVYAAFKGCTVLWYRVTWPTLQNSRLGFEARLSSALSADSMRTFADRDGQAVADLAREWAKKGQPVATLDGKHKGVCKALVMRGFQERHMHWGQWGRTVYKAQSNMRAKTGLDNPKPGDIVFFKNVEFQQVSFDKVGRIRKELGTTFEITGHQGHLAIVAGAGSFRPLRPHEHVLPSATDPDQATKLAYPPNTGSSVPPEYLQIVDQSPRESAKWPAQPPRTRILRLGTLKFRARDGICTIYRPMIRSIWHSYGSKAEIGDKAPWDAMTSWTDIVGSIGSGIPVSAVREKARL